jgi:PAS domain S-box-containing protein
MPHGHCFFWQPSLIWLHVISDILIAAAYFSIPLILYYFIRLRPDVKQRGLILTFAGFMLACGTTHVLSVWDIWHSVYRLEGLLKAITAALSVAIAIVMVRLGPAVVKIASPDQLEEINQALREEMTARNLAEEKLHSHVEAELLASEDKLHSCFEAASQAILGVSSSGRVSLVNRRTEEMFGYSRDELLGHDLEILLPERFRTAHITHRDGYFAEPRVRAMGAGMELAGRRKDGTEFPIEIGLSHVKTPEGPLAFGMVSDISERKKAADELERVNIELRHANAELIATQDELRSYFEAASQAILGVSSDGHISLVNRRTEEMFGYTREELLGKELELLLPDRFRHVHVAHRDGYFAEPRVRAMGAGMELAGRRKDGTEFPIEIGLGHANTPEGPLAFGMVSDISERKKAADDLKHVNEELRRSVTEMEQFAHVASHDLQEPLRMVTGYLQLIDRRYADLLDANGKEFIGFAVDGAKRMKILIRDLLEFSRTGTHAANFRRIDSGSIVDNAVANLKTAIDESAAKITIDPLPAIFGDPVLLTQVFQNLIANAIKFQNSNAPCVHISARRQGAEWIYSVHDNGIGIESRHLDRIFLIFERLHSTEEYSGSGIGLAITRKIVERHQGRIWVESQPGAGSTFFFSVSAEMEIAANTAQLRLSATP